MKNKILIDEAYIKDVLEAIDETKKIEALFELKYEYFRIKNLKPSDNNDFIQDPLIERIKELQKDPKFIKEINAFIKKHTS